MAHSRRTVALANDWRVVALSERWRGASGCRNIERHRCVVAMSERWRDAAIASARALLIRGRLPKRFLGFSVERRLLVSVVQAKIFGRLYVKETAYPSVFVTIELFFIKRGGQPVLFPIQ